MSTESTLGILPEGWDTRKLKLCLEKLKSGKYVERGWSPQCLSRPAQNAWGVLKTTSVQMGEFLPEYNKELPKSLEPKVGLEVNDGDFLVTTTGPRNRCGVVCRVRTTPRNLIFSGKILRFRADESQVLGSYLMYLLMSPGYQKELDGLKVGTSDSSVSIGNQQILDLEIPLASIEEQAKIVEILEEQLSRLDAALVSVHAVREKASRFRRSLLHAAFTGLLTNQDTLPGELPEGWVQKQLSDVCLKVSKVDPLDLNRETFKYVDIGSIESETNSVKSPQVLSIKDAPGRARQLLHQGDSVFSTVRPYLKNIAYINNALDGEIASTGFCVIRPNPKLVSLGLLKFFVISDNLLEQILPLQRGVSYPAVRDKEVLSASINLPPPDEQKRIVEILEEQSSRLNASLAIADAIEKKASALRRSLLHAAFNGDLTKEWREGAHV